MEDYSGAYGFIATPSMVDITRLQKQVDDLKAELDRVKSNFLGDEEEEADYDVVVTKKYFYVLRAKSAAEAKAIFLDQEDKFVPDDEDMIDIEVNKQ